MKKILLVEDTAELSDLVQRELVKEGYEVQTAGDGRAALERFSSFEPDLVILDWMLPEMDGLEVLRRIRSFSPVPILMLTARSDEIDRVVGLEVGADDYLTKPFGMRELLARITALLRRIDRVQQILAEEQKDEETGLLRCGRISIHPDTRQVWVDQQKIELTPIEFALLHLFVRYPGRVFSRAYLLETIWEQSFIPGDRSVDNAILRLRKKLGEPGSAIESQWGMGYRLNK